MKANSASDWLKRWGLLILLGIAVVLIALCWLFPVSRRGKPQILKQAQEGAATLKARAASELTKITAEMDARRAELDRIEAIESEDERLRELAEFANWRDGK